MKIAIISASNRISRLSHRVSLHLQQRMKNFSEVEAELIDLSQFNIPAFEETLSKLTAPPSGLQQLQHKIQEADAFILVSPEYNGSFTSALKNAVEHLDEKSFRKKAAGIVSVTSGGNGGVRGGMQMQQLMLAIWSVPAPVMLLVPHVEQKFDAEGTLTDSGFENRIKFFVDEFLWMAEAFLDRRKK